MRYLLLFLGIGLVLIGMLWVGRSYRFIRTAKLSIAWPVALGVIAKSNVLSNGRSYLPSVEYAYDVNGRSYAGDSVNVGLPFSASKEWAETITSRYHVGRSVSVAFDPSNPSSSVLEPGARRHMYFPLTASVLMVVLGCAVLLIACTAAK